MAPTGFYSHRSFLAHAMEPGHPECPERLTAIADWLLATGVADALDQREAPPATDAQLLRAHSADYLGRLQALHRRLEQDIAAGGPELAGLDPDTSINLHTLSAARHASGAAVAATDAVIAGELDNAFCAVRPPGHHACRDRAMGFCFYNHVAVAALHALEHHGLSRVAVIDFDVHHGNGTEDILAGDDRVLMASFFQHPFYPHSGTERPAANMCNLPVPAYTTGLAVRELAETYWRPRLEDFRPEMVFVSAGFDAHRADDMGQLGLTEPDFAWLTRFIRGIADRFAGGRIVSCLEGGYVPDALARSVEAHLRVLAGI
jgi:acetoin utilization deacetylase AcuC-like enzyme